ncbi:MAG TPA: L,D-transpeptidase family protein [Anaeromyxobacteraceae bacterium]|nr:L,D-transpeptidase family protein [Anaeromyxobacteraceae bacterium]
MTGPGWSRSLTTCFIVTAAIGLVGSACRIPPVDPCSSSDAAILVLVSDHSMWLCDRGRAQARYRVALGRGGFGKKVEGDGKTPLGTYGLGAPRASARFGSFIPVSYPTEEQKREGFSGRDVGIHGPDRRLRWAGSLNSWLDWTGGCIALGSDDELQQVAEFVRERRPHISIRSGAVSR